MDTKPVFVKFGTTYEVEMPFSEAMMAAGLSGKICKVKVVNYNQAIVQYGEGSFIPYLPCEAGLFWDSARNKFYFYKSHQFSKI